MFLKVKDSTRRVIQDMYEVWLPPKPKRHQILFADLRKEDQYWRRPKPPKDWEERRAEELIHQRKEMDLVEQGFMTKIKYFDPVLERYRRQEWMRRIYGVWFMNNGVPTYLTGLHYWFLAHCKLDHQENDGYPLFYEPQLDRFYFRELCMQDPFCHGYIMVGPRGSAKTAEEVAAQLENMTKPPHDRFAAIQSKTEDDAKTVIFQEKMVPMFNMLLDFWKPEFSHGTEPKDKFIFKRKSDRSKNARDVKHGPQYELGNTILCYPPQNKVLDGKTLSDIINDEIGKLKPETEMDAYTRNGVNVRTVYRNKVKRGLIRATTTVEEMEQGGDECLEIWQESDPTIRDGNGFTLSKLYRFFISALDTQTDLADKYGRIPLDKAMIVIDNERAPFKGQPEKLTPLMRKNPKTAEEAFIKDQSKTLFDTIIISNRVSELEAMKRKGQLPGRCYTPSWVNGIVDGDVELIPDDNGRVRLFFHPDAFDPTNKRKILNATKSYKDPHDGKVKFKPVNNDLWRIGVDPIRTVKTDDPRASQMAVHGYMYFNLDLDFGKEQKDYISDNILFEYCHRDTDPENNYEEVIMMMRWLGCSALVEQNAGEFNKHLRSRGYERFLIYRKNFSKDILDNKNTKNSKSGENPVSTTVEVIESYVKRIAAKVKRAGMRINSLPLLYQLAAFDPKKPTKYDLVVSFGYALLAVEATLEDEDEYEKMAEDVIEVFDRYDISGNQSKLMPSKYNSGESDEFDNDCENPHYVEELLYGRP